MSRISVSSMLFASLLCLVSQWSNANSAKPLTPQLPGKVDAQTYKGERGKIVIPYAGKVTIMLLPVASNGWANMSEIDGSGGTFVVPVGTFRVSMQGTKTSGESTWRFSSQLVKPVTVRSGSTEKVSAGPPFKAEVSVLPMGGDNVSMNLSLTGSGGESVTISGPERNAKPPGFEVVSESGNVLWAGSFAYG